MVSLNEEQIFQYFSLNILIEKVIVQYHEFLSNDSHDLNVNEEFISFLEGYISYIKYDKYIAMAIDKIKIHEILL